MTRTFRHVLSVLTLLATVTASSAAGAQAAPADAKEVGGDFTTALFTAPVDWTAWYGDKASGRWLTKSGKSRVITCSPAMFGSDPAPNVPKKCYVKADAPFTTASCASDFGTCEAASRGWVYYGAAGHYNMRYIKAKAQVACTPTFFGSDPAPNVPKKCFFVAATSESMPIRDAPPESNPAGVPYIKTTPTNPLSSGGDVLAGCRASATSTQVSECKLALYEGVKFYGYARSDGEAIVVVTGTDYPGRVLLARIELPGARYVYDITVDAAAKTVTYWGEARNKVTISWSALAGGMSPF